MASYALKVAGRFVSIIIRLPKRFSAPFSSLGRPLIYCKTLNENAALSNISSLTPPSQLNPVFTLHHELLQRLVASLSRCSRLTLMRAHSTTTALHQGVPGSLWRLGRLNHIAIAVPDMEKATALYRDVLGATVSDKVPLPEHGVYTVFVELGNTKLELLHPLGEKSPIAGFLQKNKSGGMHHICIEVDNIDAAIADLKAKKIRTLSAEPRIGAHGKPVMFLHPKDCDGVLVELEEA